VNIIAEIFEIRSCVEILAKNKIEVYTTDQYKFYC